MNIILETERLILREFLLSDAPAFYELNNDMEVMQFTGDKPFKSVQEAEELIANYSDYKKNGFGRNTVVSKLTQDIIGWCGLKKHANGLVDLGYRFKKKYWNQGYATESAHAILDMGFQHYSIEEIVGRTSERNVASIRVLEKLGMKYSKKEPCEGISDSLHYIITKVEWQKLK